MHKYIIMTTNILITLQSGDKHLLLKTNVYPIRVPKSKELNKPTSDGVIGTI